MKFGHDNDLDQKRKLLTREKKEYFVYGAIVAFCVGTVIPFYGISWVSENIETWAAVIVGALIASAIIASLFLVFFDRLIERVKKRTAETINPFSEEFNSFIESVFKRNQNEARSSGYVLLSQVADWYIWLNFKKWAVYIVVIIFGGTIGMVAALLLYKQNILFEEQNKLILEQYKGLMAQIERQDSQIQQQKDQWTTQRRADLVALLYEERSCPENSCMPKASLRARTEAAIAFVSLERDRVKNIQTTDSLSYGLDTPKDDTRPDLDYVKLQHADLDRVSWDGVSLRKADLSRASFRLAKLSNAYMHEANLSESSLTRSDLTRSDLSSANLSRASLGWVEFDDKTKLQGTNMCGAKFSNDVNFNGANIFGAIMLGVEFVGSEVPCKILRTAKDWEQSVRDQSLACGEEIPVMPKILSNKVMSECPDILKQP